MTTNLQIVEPLVSFETAKLGKQAGFHWIEVKFLSELKYDDQIMPFVQTYDPTVHNRSCYNDNGVLITPKFYSRKNSHYPAPSLSIIQKWLRDVHRYHIEIGVGGHDGEMVLWHGDIYRINGLKYEWQPVDYAMDDDTYEKVLEMGIVSTLKFIIANGSVKI